MSDPLVILDDALLLTLARNQAALTEFPVLQNLTTVASAPRGRGCGGCGGQKTDVGLLLNSVKASLANMPPDKKRTLLRLLNAQRVRIIYFENGRTVSKTIEQRPETESK